MTNFDKALEVEKKIEEASENFKLSDIPYPPLKNIFKAGCEHGYTLGRQFTVQEVCDFMREKSNAFLVCKDADRYKIGLHWSIHADAIEKHFKDRGEKV